MMGKAQLSCLLRTCNIFLKPKSTTTTTTTIAATTTTVLRRCMSARARTIEESKHVETQSSQMARLDELFSDEQLVANYLAKNSPLIDYGKVMKMEGGEKMSLYQKSMRRPVWEEMDCSNGFPPTPEAANLTVLQYLEQR